MRQCGRTTRVILNLVDYLINNTNPGSVVVAAGNRSTGLYIKNKAMEICATLGVVSNKTIKIATTDEQLRGAPMGVIFDDHSWYEAARGYI